MALQLPEWYTDSDVDVERLIVNYFRWIINGTLDDVPPPGGVGVDTWLPDGWYTPWGATAPQPFLRVWRQPGAFDASTDSDNAVVQVASLSQSRHDSWKLSRFVRRAMLALDEGAVKIPYEGGVQTVKKVTDYVGPQQIPETSIDDKFIPETFRVRVRMPRDLDDERDYLASIKALPLPS